MASLVTLALRRPGGVRVSVATVSLFALGCTDGTTEPAQPAIPSTRLSAFVVDDTITKQLARPIVIIVRDSSGRVAKAASVTVSVEFVSAVSPGSSSVPLYLTLKSAPTGGTTQLVGQTDGAGQLEVWARTGSTSGSIRLRAASKFGRDSLDGTIRPGHATHFSISPTDTALYAGGSIAPSIVARDVYNNAFVPTGLTARRPSVLDIDGSTLIARSIGRAYVVVSADGARDSIGVSVVPRGTLIAATQGASANGAFAFVTFDLDGSNYRTILRTPTGFNNFALRWNETLNRLIYHSGGFANNAVGLFALTLNGTRTTFLPPLAVSDGSEESNASASITFPSISADGNFVYFAASTAYSQMSIWRVRSDGTGATRVGPSTWIGAHDGTPSVSPDGRFLVYTTDRNSFGASTADRLMRLDLNTGESLSLATLGVHPTWSPRGDEIAYMAGGEVRVIKPDGTGEASVVKGVNLDGTNGQLAWSADGLWLASCATGQFSGSRFVVVMSRSTGEVLPLAFTARENLCGATWK
jgi:hypothetical protein